MVMRFLNFYFSISEYVDHVLNEEENDLVDCRDVSYVNKCSLKGLKNANKIKTTSSGVLLKKDSTLVFANVLS